LPDIRTLFTVNLYGDFRAHDCADRASVAFFGFIDAHGVIALRVVFLGWHDMVFGAEMHAELAFLAKFLFDVNITFQNISLNLFLPVVQFLLAAAILLIMFIKSRKFHEMGLRPTSDCRGRCAAKPSAVIVSGPA
jgi:hypothetical protein